jgi:hypothetical protein
MEEYNQMDVTTSTAFDIFFNGIFPVLFSTFFEPLLSATTKSKIEDFFILFVEPFIPLLYVFNKITYNQFTQRYFIFICVYISSLSIVSISHYYIFIWLRKKGGYFKYKSFKHCMIIFYYGIIETLPRFLPVFCFENVEELGKIAFKQPNAVAVLGIILLFLIFALILPHIMYSNKDDFPVIGNIIFALHIFSSFFASIIYLVIIPSNVIYVKLAFNINLLLIMRFFSISEDKPSNKKKGWFCVVLFAFEDTEDIEREIKKQPKVQDWYMKYLSHPVIKRMIDKIKKIIDNNSDEDEDRSNCNKANILYYYKYGEYLEKKKNIQNNETFVLKSSIPGIKLRNEIKKAKNVYRLFNGIGIDKINNITSLSADDIARLELNEIDEIINKIKPPNITVTAQATP